jgi:hypothetical protein
LEENCSLGVVQTDRHSLKWTSTSDTYRKEVRGFLIRPLKNELLRAGNSIKRLSGEIERR